MIEGAARVYGIGGISVTATSTLEGDCSLTGTGELSCIIAHIDLLGEGSLVCDLAGAHILGEGTCTVLGLVALNIHDIQNFIVDLSDREIYNDIRAECDLTDILTLDPEELPEFFVRFIGHGHFYDLAPHETVEIEVVPREDYHTEITWLGITDFGAVAVERGWVQAICEALGGDWYPPIPVYGEDPIESVCNLPDSFGKIGVEIVHRRDTSCTVEVESKSDYTLRGHVYVEYLCLTPETRFFNLSAIDATSIQKYGRRTLPLNWSLGQTPDQMQEILDYYLAKHKEPVPFIDVTIMGKTEALQQRIAESEINDRIWVPCPVLEMDEEFWLNNINCRHDVQDCLEAIFDLEQIRDMER